MGIKKTTSLKAAFWKFLCMLLIGLLLSVLIPFSLVFLGNTFGFLTYADYSERIVKNMVPVIEATPDLKKLQLPNGCNYLVLDKNYRILKSSLNEDELNFALEYARSGKQNQTTNEQYLLVTRENEYVVVQYKIGSQFTNNWLTEHLPSPEVLLYLLIGINCIMVCITLTKYFSSSLRVQLSPLFQATAQIAKQNLEFDIGHSNVREFEEVLLSFSEMKEHLKISLQQQWKTEQFQKEQITALAHDLKTPLTVIQGNIDLINETELTQEQQLYAGYITESAEQMQLYIKTLIELSRTVAGYQVHLEKLALDDYLKKIELQTNALCLPKKLSLHTKVEQTLGHLWADKLLLERAIMNVLNNAIDHSPPFGAIYLTVQKDDLFLQISITDEGAGFTPEELQHAKEQFFVGDAQRNSRMHFGLGLYITNYIIQQHNGQLILSNSQETTGARVILKIPYDLIANEHI